MIISKIVIIETINDELKNIAKILHSRYRCFDNFMVNLLRALAVYFFFPKKPKIRVQTVDISNERQLTFSKDFSSNSR